METGSLPVRLNGTGSRAGAMVPLARLEALRLVRPAPEPVKMLLMLVSVRAED